MALDEIRRLIREALGVMPTLDLHGLGVRAALRETEKFLTEAQEECLGSVRIVYGKGKRSPGGRGVLREAIPGWLDGEGRRFVRRWERRPDSTGADGGMIVWVREIELDEEEEA